MATLTETTRTHLQKLLLLSIWLRPDGGGMSPESKQQTDDVREK